MPEINETPSIDNEIEILSNATFGEEVRQAIIDALTKCYTDVIAAALSGIKKGDSVDTVAISNGELIVTILNNETSETTTVNCGRVVGDSITNVSIDSDGYMWVTIGNGEPQKLNKCLIGPPGETGHEGHIDVDPTLDHSYTSGRPVTNAVITRAIDDLESSKASINYVYSKSESDNKYLTEHQDISGKQDKLSPSDAQKLTMVGNRGQIKASGYTVNSSQDLDPTSYTKIPTEARIGDYTYSKTESDNKYVQLSQIDQELDDESNNPVANSTITQKIEQIENDYSAPDATIDITSTHPVQNKAVAEALNGKVNISDFNDTIFDDIDIVFSKTNGGIYYDGDCPAAPALFIEAEGGNPNYPTGYAYYLSYVDSLYDSDDNPHWHRIANISNLVTRVVPVDNELSESSKNPVQNKVVKAALDKKMEYADESYATPSLNDINHFTDPNKIYHFYLGLNDINEMVDLIFIIDDDEADWDNEIYPYSCQFMISQSGKIYYRKTDDQGLFGNVHDYMENYYTKSEIDAMLNSQ